MSFFDEPQKVTPDTIKYLIETHSITFDLSSISKSVNIHFMANSSENKIPPNEFAAIKDIASLSEIVAEKVNRSFDTRGLVNSMYAHTANALNDAHMYALKYMNDTNPFDKIITEKELFAENSKYLEFYKEYYAEMMPPHLAEVVSKAEPVIIGDKVNTELDKLFSDIKEYSKIHDTQRNMPGKNHTARYEALSNA